jgi:hypothetical protein
VQRFRAMVWPGEVPPVSHVETLGPYRLDGEIIRLDLEHAEVYTVDIPDELYLRELRDLDLTESAAIIGFVNTYGRLGHRHPTLPRDNPDLNQLVKELAVHQPGPIIQLLGVNVPNESTLDWESWREEVVEHPSNAGRSEWETRQFIADGIQHIDTFRAWAEAFHILTETCHRYLGLDADEQRFILFAVVLEELLHPFSPRIGIPYDDDLDTVFDPFRFTHARLENVLVLQMYRHIAAEDSYKPCENENCGRLFVHQIGRSKYGQNRRSGVKYCSSNCASAKGERERRRKKKEEKD